METGAEKLMAELCELVAREKDQAELKRLISQLIECLQERQRERGTAEPNGSAEEPAK